MQNGGPRQRRRRRRWGALAAILIAAVAHVYYWYWPRMRAATPAIDSPVAALVLAEQLPGLRLWLPFPHQNLAYIGGRLADLEALGVVTDELLGLQVPALPSFGPFRLPPAREMAVAFGPAGERVTVVARVYPLAARVFRAAGWLADNPWMAGGEVELEGRAIRVEWRGDLWVASTAESLPPVSAVTSGAIDPCLVLVRLPAERGDLPSGPLRLSAVEGRWLLTSSLEGPVDEDVAGWGWQRRSGVALSWIRFAGQGGQRRTRSLLVARSNDDRRLPPVLTVYEAPLEPWPLPGEKILGSLGVEVYQQQAGAWTIRSYDRGLLPVGEGLVGWLSELAGSADSRTSVVAHLDLAEASRSLLAVGEALARVPIVGEREARKWLALGRLLSDFPDGAGLSLRSGSDGSFELEIDPESVD